jgi:hypothetical protein
MREKNVERVYIESIEEEFGGSVRRGVEGTDERDVEDGDEDGRRRWRRNGSE